MKITKENAETILAFYDGKQIQYSNSVTNSWEDIHNVPTWSFDVAKYRVKPDPKSLWVNEYENGIYVYKEKHKAVESAGDSAIRIAVHYREVIEG